MMSFLALNLQFADASVAAIHDMPIEAATNALASRRAIVFPFGVCIGLAGPPLATPTAAGLRRRRPMRRLHAFMSCLMSYLMTPQAMRSPALPVGSVV